jgi:hypothetical protein
MYDLLSSFLWLTWQQFAPVLKKTCNNIFCLYLFNIKSKRKTTLHLKKKKKPTQRYEASVNIYHKISSNNI